jgi:hypothetical protein
MNHEMLSLSQLMHGQRLRDMHLLLGNRPNQQVADGKLHTPVIDPAILPVHQENASGIRQLEGPAAHFQCWPRNHWIKVPGAYNIVPTNGSHYTIMHQASTHLLTQYTVRYLRRLNRKSPASQMPALLPRISEHIYGRMAILWQPSRTSISHGSHKTRFL